MQRGEFVRRGRNLNLKKLTTGQFLLIKDMCIWIQKCVHWLQILIWSQDNSALHAKLIKNPCLTLIIGYLRFPVHVLYHTGLKSSYIHVCSIISVVPDLCNKFRSQVATGKVNRKWLLFIKMCITREKQMTKMCTVHDENKCVSSISCTCIS